ncbi:MAG TPA: hypothetical protein DCS93_11995 [Microscillaceae bacterium]|nr:hypothetical protein [Microscillaceae bacterium]
MSKSKSSFKTAIIILFVGGLVWLFASQKVQVESPNSSRDINLVKDEPTSNDKRSQDRDLQNDNQGDKDEISDSFDKDFDQEFNINSGNEDVTISIEVNGKKTVIRNSKELKELSRELENVGREIQQLYLREVSDIVRKWSEQDADEIKDDVNALKRKLKRKLKSLENQYDEDKLRKLERKLMKQLDALTEK